MTTDRETAEVIRSWMKEEVQLNDAGIHRVLARLPDTPQRRHRWLWPLDWHPFAPGATRSADVQGVQATGRRPGPIPATTDSPHIVTGRTRLMFSPVKAIIASALAFALGGAFLIAQPFGQQEGLAPGAEPAGIEGARVTVAQDCPELEDSIQVCTWTSSDPRLTGTMTMEMDGAIELPAGVVGGDFFWVDATVEGPEGTWTGRLYINGTDPSASLAVLSGSGAYEGWQYVATDIGGNGYHFDWNGVIYEGELPPFGPPGVSASE
jgi:hypothetical protein